MKYSYLIYSIIIGFTITMASCSDDNSPGGNNNGGGTSGIVITTTSATNISNSGAVSGGNITSDGGSAIVSRGVCWSTTANPTISNSHTNDGSSVGVFTSNISGLTAGTLYYVRAYAANANTTGYGNQITITTTGGGGSGSGGCAGGPTTVTDIDGNVYNVVSIGNQCWMKENLKTTHYKNGTPIPTGLSDAQWQNMTSGACADYDNNSTNTVVYGKLYNGYAVADTNGLCPIGWHVSSEYDWNKLVKSIDLNADTTCQPCVQSFIFSGAIKEIGLTHWSSPNTGATNTSGFTALPGGFRIFDGQFSLLGTNSIWWTATPFFTAPTINYTRMIGYSDCTIYKEACDFSYGYSVRCVRD